MRPRRELRVVGTCGDRMISACFPGTRFRYTPSLAEPGAANNAEGGDGGWPEPRRATHRRASRGSSEAGAAAQARGAVTLGAEQSRLDVVARVAQGRDDDRFVAPEAGRRHGH